MDPQHCDFLDDRARDVVRVEGTDATSYLQSQLAQELRPMEVGATRWTLVLEPNGRVAALARVTRADDEVWVLDTDAGYGDALKERLERFRIRVDVKVDVQPAANAEASDDHEASRVAAGWPRMGAEIVPGETIPSASGVVPLAVDFAKGCYPGQELVERMNSRGTDAPQTLRIVDVSPDARPGEPITDADGVEVGELTSIAGAIGLGYVRRGVDGVGRPPAHLA